MDRLIRNVQFSALPGEIRTQLAFSADIKTAVALARCCSEMAENMKVPLLYVKIRMGWAGGKLPVVSDWLKPRLELLVLGLELQARTNGSSPARVTPLQGGRSQVRKHHTRSASQPTMSAPVAEHEHKPILTQSLERLAREPDKADEQTGVKLKSVRTAKPDAEPTLSARQAGIKHLMGAKEAMESITREFEDVLGDLGSGSRHLLENVLDRAANPEVWKCDSSAALQAHTDLLCAIGESFFHQRKARKLEVQAYKRHLLDALRVFVVALFESREYLNPARLQLFAGELLRTCAWGSSAKDRKHLASDPVLRKLWVETGLFNEEEWKNIAGLATSSMQMHAWSGYAHLAVSQAEAALANAPAPHATSEVATSGNRKTKRKRPASMQFKLTEPKPDPKESCTVS